MSEENPRPWEQEPEPSYPRQQLLPHEVKPGRSRRPLAIGRVLALVLVVGGGVAYFLTRDDGEATRQAYCRALRDLTRGGDLMAAVEGADSTTLDQLNTVERLAPGAVSDDWSTLMSIADAAKGGSPDMAQALTAFNALKVIATDAKQNCGLDLGLPLI